MSIVSGIMKGWAPPTDKPDVLYEFVDGLWKEAPPMGALATLLASFLVEEMGRHSRANKLGLVMAETLFRIAPDGLSRRPDVAYVSWDRWPYKVPLEEDPPAFDVVPNLAVEVNSPTNTFDQVLDKVKEYCFAGTELVWVVAPRQRLVYAYKAPDETTIFSEKNELDGGKVLPGFKLSVAALFAASAPSP